MTQITIANAGGTLECDAIAWNEGQICKVAVRDVPLRTTGAFIDTGTYTLKNRKIRTSIRLSDAQKTTLQAIFNQSALVTITAVQGSKGTWTYTAWLRKKPIMYEYSNNSAVREWIAELEFDVGTTDGSETFTFTPPDEYLCELHSKSVFVDASSTDYATRMSHQRKTFYANGRFWVFYSNGTNTVYNSSTDCSTWKGATIIVGGAEGLQVSVFFDGTYVHYAIYTSTTATILYRRGVPESDGTITWSAVQQTVFAKSNSEYYSSVAISVDSSGHAWIGVRGYDGSDYCPYVFKNNNTDGTWATAAGFPYKLNVASSVFWRVFPVPLTDSKVYVIYVHTSGVACGRLYTGSWGSEETDLADYTNRNSYFSAVNEGDNVHFVYLRQTTYQIRYNKRVYGVGWQANDELVEDAVEATTSPALCIDDVLNCLYCFWARTTTDHIYYKKRVGVWDGSATDWIDESGDQLKFGYSLTVFYKNYDSKIGLLYVTKLASLYNVDFAYSTITCEES